MRIPLLAFATFTFAATMSAAILHADAEPPKSSEVYVKVEHLTTRVEFLSAAAQEQLTKGGVASGKSMAGARLNLAASVASGKTSVLDSYTFTIPSGSPIRF